MTTQNKKLVTHNGSFHADDVFATATLGLYLEKKGEVFEVIRTRDEELINNADYVFDVGGIYDEEKKRFDHHQIGGAGKRNNGIEYSSFGLIWKKFGIDICENKKVVDAVDKKLVAPIDAGDNGMNLVENKNEVSPYLLQYFCSAMHPTWREEDLNKDEMFLKSVEIAKIILSREIIQSKDAIMVEDKVIDIYNNSQDKRIIILDKNYPYGEILSNFSEPLFVIYPREDGFYTVKAIRNDMNSFKNRKDLPSSWAGLRDEELQKITGVEDVVFCHRGLFITVAKTKEGAIELAKKALAS
ncbi:MAG: MYG1 family protein [Candidatus Parcubacteria bacterium]|nr:MYG1 family protein [Candidatus Parcubacteria bacterium]